MAGPKNSSVGQYESCTPAQTAVCELIDDGPFTRRRRRVLQRKLRDNQDPPCGDIVGPFVTLLTQAVLNADRHRKISLWWGRLHYILGIPATVLATLSGALYTTSSQTMSHTTSAILAFAAGCFSAAFAFLKSEASRDKNNALCAGWTELADQVRSVLWDYDSKPQSHDYYGHQLICLNKCKMELLWGVLRAGPYRKSPSAFHPGAEDTSPSHHYLAPNPVLHESNGSTARPAEPRSQ